MSRRLTVITEIIAPYRVPVFNALARERGIDLHVIFLSETDPKLRLWPIYKDEINFSYEVLPSWRARIGRQTLLLNRGLGRALRNSHPDVVVCGGYNYPASWQALSWAKLHGVPFVAWIESTSREQRSSAFPIQLAKRFFVHACDAFLVPGKASAAYLQVLGAASRQIFVAANAVDTEFFAAGAARARLNPAATRSHFGLPSRFFLFVGRLIETKGVFDLVEAYGRLSPELRREIGLVFVGDGHARDQISRQAAKIDPATILVLGFLQRDHLSQLYGLAEALVFPTHSDAWGLVVNEAMACRLPVITTDVAGCQLDLVHHAENGFVIPARDLTALTECMERLASDPGLREHMGRRSADLISQYSPQNCAAGFASLHCENLQGAPRWKPVA